MELDLRSVRYFLAVAEAGKTTSAAERLHLSQPALTVRCDLSNARRARIELLQDLLPEPLTRPADHW